MPPVKPIASLYARLSVAADDSNTSLSGMVDDMMAYCERQGLDPRYTHTDDGVSGGKRQREAFTAWLDDAREGRAQVLVNPHTDRLTREGLQAAAAILDVVEGKDPVTGNIVHRPVRMVDMAGLDSEHGDAFRIQFVLRAEIARAERERIRARVRASQRRLIRAGRYRGGPTPYGYQGVKRPDGEGYTLEIHPGEADFIRECVRRVLSGQSLSRVSRWANTTEHRPRKAAEWHRNSLKKVLSGHAILGRVTTGSEPLRDDKGDIVAPYPPIIELAEHQALTQLLEANRKPVERPVRRQHLLSGLLCCASCERPMWAHTRNVGVDTYRCATRQEGHTCDRAVTCSKNAIEERLTEVYLSKYGSEPMYQEHTVVEGVDDLAAIQEEIKDCLAEISQDATPELMERLQRLQQKRREAEAKPPIKRTVRRPTGKTVAEWWSSAHLDDRRDALRAEWGRMMLHPGRSPKGRFDMTRLTFPDLVDSEEG